MAEGLALVFANGVLGKLGEILAQQVLNEASLVLNFRDDFQWLQTTLTDISGYLQAAEDQSAHSAPVKRWLSELSDIALDAEDVVDECDVDHFYRKPTQYFCVYNCGQSIFRRKMGKRIKDLKGRLSSAMQKAGQLNLVRQVLHSRDQPSTSTNKGGAELTGSILETDSRVVAMQDKVEEIEGLLEQHAVIAVLGMGGLGKTLLLQNVYDRVKQRYEYSAWISVSQTCSLRTLQCDVAKQINLQIEGGISDVLVAQLIHEYLEGKKCLIVLDDVWKQSVQGNLIHRLGLPSGTNNQCKIVVTTRENVLTEHVRAHHVYEMQLLSEEDSWNLFCLFAFPSREGNRPPEHLENLAHQIVKKCGRLPLAVKTVAASMAGRSLGLEDWKSKLGKLKDVDVGEKGSPKQILKLSYYSLPSHLKSCFAYFSFFPEDTEIFFSRIKEPQGLHEDYLIYLWMAEGFIPQGQWNVGLNYLHQLVDLCLLEVNTALSYYTVHDLLHDLVLDISREHKCEFHLPLQETTYRRLLLGKKGIDNDAISAGSVHCQGLLRTLSFSQNKEIRVIPEHLFVHLRVLRILDLSSTTISTLPKCVGKLKLLKVLNLSQTEIMEVPDCVRKLKSLEYLDVSGCKGIQRLPDWIGEVQSLTHLDISGSSDELRTHMPKEISKLSNLRTLRSDPLPLSTEENEILDVQSVGRLTNLEEISFHFQDGGMLTSLEDGALEHLVKMRILTVGNVILAREGDVEECNLPAFPENMSVFTDLQQLFLARFSVPSWICGMVNLTELSLFECSGYPSLQKMPNLRSLGLIKDSRCKELPEKFGEVGGFPKLVRLMVGEFSLLEELPALEEGAMQCLESLQINNCPRVKKVPEGLERLRRLKRIDVGAPSDEWKERLEEGGDDWKKLKARNPNIQIDVW